MSMTFTKTYNRDNQAAVAVINGWMFFSIFLMIILAGLITFYIIEVNSMATSGYEIKSYNERLDSLKVENQRLFLEKSKFSSFESLKSRLTLSDFSESKQISYLDIFESAVALNIDK